MIHNPAGLVVGFDLDLTLFDTRPAIGATLLTVAADQGVDFDVEKFLLELGPPLEELVGQQIPAEKVQAFVDHYRRIYQQVGLPKASLLPGAREAIAAVAAHGGESIVITGKNDRDANLHVEAERLDVAHVIGWSWAEAKTVALLKYGASVYIGDHPADIAAARAADALAVAVTTGSHVVEDFAEADVVLDSLIDFPAWLGSQVVPSEAR